MAIDAHSTTGPAFQPGLLPSTLIGAVPAPTPDLTAETVAMLDAIPADVPRREARIMRYGGAIYPAADLPCGVASEVLSTVETTPADSPGYISTTDLAQALHMRRSLEDAFRPRDGVISRPRASQAHGARLRAARPHRDRRRRRQTA